MGVCGFCGQRLMLVDHYGLQLCGCTHCNTWEHNGLPAAMSAEDCALLRDTPRQQRDAEPTPEMPRVEVRGRDKFKRDR